MKISSTVESSFSRLGNISKTLSKAPKHKNRDSCELHLTSDITPSVTGTQSRHDNTTNYTKLDYTLSQILAKRE